jgi:hypothetical protein
VFANTTYLPDWITQGVTHAIAVIGYDDNAGTYTYIDTCGAQCGSAHNGGTHVISQSQLFTAIQTATDPSTGVHTGGIVW